MPRQKKEIGKARNTNLARDRKLDGPASRISDLRAA